MIGCWGNKASYQPDYLMYVSYSRDNSVIFSVDKSTTSMLNYERLVYRARL